MTLDHGEGGAAQAPGPLVSIIITNYNYGEFLADAIRSALAQTYRRVECIVVDDGSTDRSRAVLAGFPNARVVLKENGGQASAARAGLAASSGSILMFLDSDDVLDPQACSAVVAAWEPGTAAVFFVLAVERGGQLTDEQLPDEPFLATGHLDYVKRYGYLPSAPTSGNAFSREHVSAVFEQAVGMDGNCFDAYLLYSAPVAGKIVSIDRRLGKYRIHDRNISLVNSTASSRVAAHVYYQFWAQQTSKRMMALKGLRVGSRTTLKGPYHLRWHLMTRDLPLGRFALPRMSRLAAVIAGIWQSAVWPAMTLRARLRNMAVVALFGVLPGPLRLKLSERLGG